MLVSDSQHCKDNSLGTWMPVAIPALEHGCMLCSDAWIHNVVYCFRHQQNILDLCLSVVPTGICCAATWPSKFQTALVMRSSCSSCHFFVSRHPSTPLCRCMLCHRSALDAVQKAMCEGAVAEICLQMESGFHFPPCRCTLCHRDALEAAREPQFEGRLRQGLGCLVCVRVTATQNTWVHEQCAFWSPEVGARARQLHACKHASGYGLGMLVPFRGG